jgi:glutathione S-transferase
MNNALRLHRHPLSGHCHRVELLASLLGLDVTLVDVNVLAGEQKKPEFLARNIFGQIPVLEDGEHTIADSNAILLYLAERYDEAHRFWPRTPHGKAEVMRWLTVAAGPLVQGAAAARLVRVFGLPLDHAAALRTAASLLTVLEQWLTHRAFLAAETLTLADVALYAYVAHAPEGDVSLEPYPAVRRWLERIEATPGFVPMQPAPKR